jgi:hypothetical protein
MQSVVRINDDGELFIYYGDFPGAEMRAEEIDQEAISNEQASLFDSQ